VNFSLCYSTSVVVLTMSTEEVKRNPRKPNWTKEEQKTLVTAISPLYGRLFGRLSNSTTNEIKATLWDQVHEQVSQRTFKGFLLRTRKVQGGAKM